MARVEIDGGGEGGEGILTISIKCRGLVKGYEGFFLYGFGITVRMKKTGLHCIEANCWFF